MGISLSSPKPALPDSKETTSDDNSTDTSLSEHTLLALPPELRNRIYGYAVASLLPAIADSTEFPTVSVSVICTRKTSHQEFWRVTQSPPEPSLALACKQLRLEVLPIYYGQNMFDIGPMAETEETIAMSRIQCLRGYLGERAAMLRHLQYVLVSRYAWYHDEGYYAGHRKVASRRYVVRLGLTAAGALKAQRIGRHDSDPRDRLYCCCDLHMRPVTRTFEAKDGNQLLDLFESCVTGHREEMPVEITTCQGCGLPAHYDLSRFSGTDGALDAA